MNYFNAEQKIDSWRIAVDNMSDSELEALSELINGMKRSRKLLEYNKRISKLLADAKADGVEIIYHPEEDSEWCITLTNQNCEAAV